MAYLKSSCIFKRGLLWIGAIVLVCLTPLESRAHEPLFSLGPHTLYKGGIGIELETELLSQSTLFENGSEISDAKNRKATRLLFPTEIIYGLSSNLSVTARIPLIRRRFEETVSGLKVKKSSNGLGDIVLRTKYRFWRRDSLGVQEAAALVFGIKLPTGDDAAELPLGSGSTDFLVGLTAAYEGRRLYLFGDLRYKANTKAHQRQAGNVFFYDAAIGFRPVLTDYYRPDLVLLLEMNAEVMQKDALSDQKLANSGGKIIWLGPNFLLSYRNLMLKGGVRFPILQDLNGTQLGSDYEAVIAIEIHN